MYLEAQNKGNADETANQNMLNEIIHRESEDSLTYYQGSKDRSVSDLSRDEQAQLAIDIDMWNISYSKPNTADADLMKSSHETISSVDELYNAANKDLEYGKAIMDYAFTISDPRSVFMYKRPDLKRRDRSIEKITNDYKGDPRKLKGIYGVFLYMKKLMMSSRHSIAYIAL